MSRRKRKYYDQRTKRTVYSETDPGPGYVFAGFGDPSDYDHLSSYGDGGNSSPSSDFSGGGGDGGGGGSSGDY